MIGSGMLQVTKIEWLKFYQHIILHASDANFERGCGDFDRLLQKVRAAVGGYDIARAQALL